MKLEDSEIIAGDRIGNLYLEMTYEEFCATFDIDPNDAQAITYEEFKELIGNEIYMSASAEFVDDND